jgi:CheY-like chemotaxis protein
LNKGDFIPDPSPRVFGGANQIADAGFEPIWATDADEAIAILESRDDIHIIFTDINMPGSMDGQDSIDNAAIAASPQAFPSPPAARRGSRSRCRVTTV